MKTPPIPVGVGHRHMVLAVLCSLAFLTYLDRVAISQVQGEVARDLHLDRLGPEEQARAAEVPAEQLVELERSRASSRLKWIFTAFLVGYILFEIPGGRLGDLFGPRRVITRIVVWWSLFTALTGSVRGIGSIISREPSPELLVGIMVAVRFLFGLGEAGAFPNIARALGRWFPPGERSRALGIVWMASRIGGAVGFVLVGWLTRVTGSWERAFWCLGASGVVWALAFSRWYRDSPEQMPGTSEAERLWISGGHQEAIAGSIYDDQPAEPPPWRRLLTWSNPLAIYACSACVSFSFYFFLTYYPQYLDQSFKVEQKSREIMSGLPILAGCLGCCLGGRICDRIVLSTGSRRWGRTLTGLTGFCLAGLFTLGASWLPQGAGPWPAVLLLSLAFFCQDLGVPCLWSLPADIGGQHAGVLGGFMNAIGALGGALSPVVIDALRHHTRFGWTGVLVTCGCVYLVAGLLWVRIDASRTLASPGANRARR